MMTPVSIILVQQQRFSSTWPALSGGRKCQECPFELVVSGMQDWDHMEARVEKWARRTAPRFWIGSRTNLSSNLFIFSMATWLDTLKILRAQESFKNTFHHIDSGVTTTFHLQNIGRSSFAGGRSNQWYREVHGVNAPIVLAA